MKLAIFFLFLSTPFLCQAQKKHEFSVGCHFISATDISVQKPDNENSFKCLSSAAYPSFEVQIDLSLNRLFQFETGYRFKQHDISFKNKFSQLSQWVETAHSIPLRIGVGSKFKQSGLLSRFSFKLSGGVLLDIMRQSESIPLVTGSQFQVSIPMGTYILRSDYNPNEVNQVKASVSLNSQIKVSYRMLKFMHIYLGYGYTEGTRTLAKGTYSIQGPTSTESGSMVTKGSYRYVMLGLQLFLRK